MSDEHYPYAEEKSSFGWGYFIGIVLIAAGLYAQLRGLNLDNDASRMHVLWLAMGLMFSGSVVSFFTMLWRRK